MRIVANTVYAVVYRRERQGIPLRRWVRTREAIRLLRWPGNRAALVRLVEELKRQG